MNFKELEQYFLSETASVYEEDEVISLFYMITENVEGWSRSLVLINKNVEISVKKLETYKKIIYELLQGKPIQYILGEAYFYGLLFKVTPAVLIPRPETEELVEWILDTLKGSTTKINSILDIGTGSGCIAISLKKNLNDTNVTALDISSEALLIAEENAKLNNVAIGLLNENILDYDGNETYDLIVSNPPYVKMDEQPDMHTNVLAHEPHLALFVSNEKPLIFYETIADFASKHLSEEGKLFFEINEYLGKETADMLKLKGYKTIVIKKDMQGKDRMIYCVK